MAAMHPAWICCLSTVSRFPVCSWLSLFSAQEKMLPKQVLCDDMKLEE